MDHGLSCCDKPCWTFLGNGVEISLLLRA